VKGIIKIKRIVVTEIDCRDILVNKTNVANVVDVRQFIRQCNQFSSLLDSGKMTSRVGSSDKTELAGT
jgi:hypothetical protein